jgi:outer membrane murein-binding lipoprotein Lpp
MEFVSDILLGLGALAAAAYCVVLSKKLNRLSGLDQELGTAIALLSKQVDEMTKVLEAAQTAADGARTDLQEATERAEEVAAQLQEASVPPSPTAPPPALEHAVAQSANGEMPSAQPEEDGQKEGAPSLFMRHSAGAS